MAEQRTLWVSTSTHTRGGIATYVLAMKDSPLWQEWDIRHISTHRDGSKLAKLLVFVSAALRFIVELIRFRPAVIHLHSGANASFVRKAALFWLGRLAGLPIVLHVHASNFMDYFEDSPGLVQALIRITLCRADAVIALGSTWAERLQRIAPTARITVIPNAVRPVGVRAQRVSNRRPVKVVFLGRIGDRKGTFRLLEAWARLDQSLATLVIAGDGEVERARQQIRLLGIGETVQLHEWLDKEAVEDLLDSADVLVLPSRDEGQPMAVLEAMARGLCVIAGDGGGLPEMIEGGCGVLVAPDDIDAIAAAMRLVIDDADLRGRYGNAAYARVVDRYDVNVVWRQLDVLYRELTSSARSRR